MTTRKNVTTGRFERRAKAAEPEPANWMLPVLILVALGLVWAAGLAIQERGEITMLKNDNATSQEIAGFASSDARDAEHRANAAEADAARWRKQAFQALDIDTAQHDKMVAALRDLPKVTKALRQECGNDQILRGDRKVIEGALVLADHARAMLAGESQTLLPARCGK